MKRVGQTRFGKEGNCFSASVASIFEISIDEVPDYREADWLERWKDWLEPRGISIERYSAVGHPSPRGWAILVVKGTDPGGHAVVAFNGVIKHDPREYDPLTRQCNLARANSATRLHWYVFTVLRPNEHFRCT